MSVAKPPPGHFVMLYFASAASYTQTKSEYLPAPMSHRQLLKDLELKYPGIRAKVLDSSAWTVNLDYIDIDPEADQEWIQDGDEVAIIPPVSSG